MGYAIESVDRNSIKAMVDAGDAVQLFYRGRLIYPVEHDCVMESLSSNKFFYGELSKVISMKTELFDFLKISSNYTLRLFKKNNTYFSALIAKDYTDTTSKRYGNLPIIVSVGETFDDSIGSLNSKLVEVGVTKDILKQITEYGMSFASVVSMEYFDFRLISGDDSSNSLRIARKGAR